MAKDKNDVELKQGDMVTLVCEVQEIVSDSNTAPNVKLLTLDKTVITLNARQAVKAAVAALLMILALMFGANGAKAQTNTQASLLNPPAIAPDFPTNNILTAAGGSAVATFALNLLPAWDRSATGRFNAKELEFEVSPTWKSATASGSTPYLSIGANYWFSKTFGAGGDMITLGNGAGSSDYDSAHLFALARKDIGNIAGHVLLGAGRSRNSAMDAEFGAGLEYRYSTGVGVLVDTRYCYYFSRRTDHEFLTRVGLTLHF